MPLKVLTSRSKRTRVGGVDGDGGDGGVGGGCYDDGLGGSVVGCALAGGGGGDRTSAGKWEEEGDGGYGLCNNEQ
ncbi:hypothetical protein Tco_1115415 [Tanacetum coccineum]